MQRSKLLSLCVLTTLSAATQGIAQRTLATHHGTQPFSSHGAALAAIADFDGDGVRDLVVGEPDHDYASSAGLVNTGAVVLRSSRTGTIRSRQASVDTNSRFGTEVAALGDVDGDGVADYAGGAPFTNGEGGRVRVLSGVNGVELWRVDGERLSQFGKAIAGVGDLNGDGLPDLAIAAPRNSDRSPFAFVRYYRGVDGSPLHQIVSTVQSEWGCALATIPDVTGDGHPDLVVGERLSNARLNAAGSLSLVDPRAPVPSSMLWSSSSPFREFEHAGSVIAAVGDLDGDMRADILTSGEDGRVFAFSGTTGNHLFTITSTLSGFGASLVGDFDFDGDGSTDFAVGAPGADTGSGRVLVYSRSGSPIAELRGFQGSAFGTSLASIGDFDGDGMDDLAVGAPFHLSNGLPVGSVSIHGFEIVASVTPFGGGCAFGTPVPNLYPAGTPRIGTRFELRCSELPRQSIGVWMLGASNTQSALGALPFDLTPLGHSGCSILVSEEFQLTFATGNAAYLSLDLSPPHDPRLLGAEMFAQAGFLVLGPQPTLSFSQGLELRVGHP